MNIGEFDGLDARDADYQKRWDSDGARLVERKLEVEMHLSMERLRLSGRMDWPELLRQWMRHNDPDSLECAKNVAADARLFNVARYIDAAQQALSFLQTGRESLPEEFVHAPPPSDAPATLQLVALFVRAVRWFAAGPDEREQNSRAAESGVRMARALGDEAIEARFETLLGARLAFSSRPGEAVERFQAAAKIYQDLPKPIPGLYGDLVADVKNALDSSPLHVALILPRKARGGQRFRHLSFASLTIPLLLVVQVISNRYDLDDRMPYVLYGLTFLACVLTSGVLHVVEDSLHRRALRRARQSPPQSSGNDAYDE